VKILHLIKSRPDDITNKLVELISQGEEAAVFRLYEQGADYGALLDLVFSHDRVISWW
jgi:hypothetical protein